MSCCRSLRLRHVATHEKAHRSGNLVSGAKTFEQFRGYEQSTTMIIEGTATRAAIVLAVVVAGASITWNLLRQQNPIVQPLMSGGLIEMALSLR
ncbi:MAG: hypothetical protein O3B13_22835 [Planctomycetota bacterium]|nr:hypothetical protein [Planctomycetota bacterium]MDA1165943.1 hypothetical protein [Planctomycetota bacterium]